MAAVKLLDSPDLYTVGWIAALPIERAAATAMLDERHDKPCGFIQHQTDTNSYTWGKMGEHNVVIASLPAGLYGTTSAATTASSLLASLPQIRMGLLVGIGGGIARPERGRDIRLGDVVVSQPQGTTGGVIQYDLVKAKANQKRERKVFLSMPPQVLLQALASLQAEHELGESRVPGLLSAMPRKMSQMANGYIHQGFENDRLFKPSYDHVLGYDCHSCNTTEEVERDERYSTDPETHYGIIASGNMLIKDAATRDKIVEDVGEECICFEMEAAGLMNHFPCLVIRGICDYADSHKNDRWQRYASATAAAYGKELLSYVPTRDLQETKTALYILGIVGKDIKRIQSVTRDTKIGVESLKSDNHLNKVEKWLASPDPSSNLNEAQKKRQEGTGKWFLQSKPFQEWKSGRHQYLWLHGIPGCGKTVLSSMIIEHLNQQLDSSDAVLNFFFDFSDTDKQSLDKLVRSLTAQLYGKCEKSQKALDKLFSSCEDGRRQPTFEPLFDTFLQMVTHVKKVQIVIDALDECNTRSDLLSWMEDLANSSHAGLHVLATSRKEEDIESELKRWLHRDNIIAVEKDHVNDDICAYIHERLQQDRGFERWHSQPSVQDEIETELMKKADGMFRWAACQLDILQKSLDLRMLRESLRSLPKTLQETYARILAKIDENYRKYAIRILQFLTYSERPLTIQEAVDVMVVDPSGDPPFDSKLRMPEPREIMRICSSLVSLTTRKVDNNTGEMLVELQLAHFSVQQYLKSERIGASFPKELTEVSVIFEQGICEISARASMTRVCLAYLSHLDEQRPVGEIRAEFPLAQYSAQYWMDHAQLAEAQKDVQESALSFFLQQGQAYTVWRKLFDPDRPWDREPKQFQLEDIVPPLYYASLGGLQRTVEKLLNNGANANAQGGKYSNALQAASTGGHKEIVQMLLEAGADVDTQGGEYSFHGTPLMAASEKGHENVVELLLAAGAKVNLNQYRSRITALALASANGYERVVEQLLGSGAYDGFALDEASKYGHEKVVEQLLAAGADVNARYTTEDYDGTPLIFASEKGHEKVVKQLLAAGADMDAYIDGTYTNDGTALTAASREGHMRVVDRLLAAGANININSGECNGTALAAASLGGHERVVQMLLENEANVDAQGGKYGNALQAASYQGHDEIIQMLLEAGADVDTQGGKYGNALQAACYMGHDKVVQMLLERGVDVNAQGGHHGNALQAASSGGHNKIVQILLEYGADQSVPYRSP